MSKRPVNLTLNKRVIELAEKIMELRGHSSLSGFVEELIRDEYDRRHGPLLLKEGSAAGDVPKPKTEPVNYRHKAHGIVAFLALVGLSIGCSTSSHVLVGNQRAAIQPTEVHIYLHPPPKFEEIAVLDVNSLWSFRASQQGHMDAAMDRLKAEAAKLGANGVLLSGVGTDWIAGPGVYSGTTTVHGHAAYSSGVYSGTSQAIKTARGVAIYVTEQP